MEEPVDPQIEQARKLKEQELKLRSALKMILDDSAFQRLSLMRMSNESLYAKVVQYIFAMYQAGRITGKISEEQLKKIASLFLSSRNEGKINISRK